MGSFFLYYLGGEPAFASLWNGSAAVPGSVAPAKVRASYLPAGGARRDISRFDGFGTGRNDLGGTLSATGVQLANPCGGADSQTLLLLDQELRFPAARTRADEDSPG